MFYLLTSSHLSQVVFGNCKLITERFQVVKVLKGVVNQCGEYKNAFPPRIISLFQGRRNRGAAGPVAQIMREQHEDRRLVCPLAQELDSTLPLTTFKLHSVFLSNLVQILTCSCTKCQIN